MTIVQKALLNIIRLSNFNSLDGKTLYDDLLLHENEWKSVVPDCAYGVGYQARNLAQGEKNLSFDTVFIITKSRDLTFWEDFGKKHQADEIDWLTGNDLDKFLGIHSVHDSVPVLRLWWD
jgi:hypothetical protein